MKNPFIIGDMVYLRAFEPGDEKIIAISENHPIARETLYYARPSSLETLRDKLQRMNNDPNSIIFTICTKEPDNPVGMAAFVRIDWVGRMAIYYIAIAESENRLKGFGSETTRLIMDYAFNTLNLNRVQLHVAVENEKAIAVYKKTGFQIEGTLRQAMYRDGKYHNFYVMGLLKSDFLKS